MVTTPAADRPEFAEIPAELREAIDAELRAGAFDLLHAEAVERGDLPAAPDGAYAGSLGSLLRALCCLAAGAVLGLAGVLLVLFLLRTWITLL